MASSQTILKISKESQAALVSYMWNIRTRWTYFYTIRQVLESADREYYRENNRGEEHQRARLANNLGDASRFQDVTVPIVADQVDSWTAFMTEVFCSQTPIFPVVAPPKYADAALQMNALLDKQARKGRWKSELIKFFRDCGKYGLGACEVSWTKANTALIETDLKFSSKEGKPRNIIWEGNSIKRLDLYNTFWDTTVLPQDVATKGEYAGYHELVSRNRIKQIIAELGEDAIIPNINAALNSGTMLTEYYVPQVNPEALTAVQSLTQGMDWFSWAGLQNNSGIAYKGLYIITTLYARILPADFGIQAPQPNTPQVWKFLIVNFSTIIYIERQTNAHEMIPVLFACPNDDGIKYQTKSLAANMKPFQQVASALMNSVMASRRRAISDKGLFNPLYVDEKNINSKNPTAKIPIKPAAYQGVPLNEIYWPIPFSDDQASISLQETQLIGQMADQLAGQNKAQRGQFQKGNKTLSEYQDVMSNADSKPKSAAIVLEDQFFTPAKHILGINIMQYQGNESLYYADTDNEVIVDPLMLRQAVWEFKITDGAIPANTEMHADVWQTALQIIGSSQQLQSGYNVAGLFSYMIKLQGADIKEFEKPKEQLMFEQAQMQWQAAVAQIVKANPQASAQQFPPQPLPADYGLNPDGTVADKSGEQEEKQESLIQQIMEAGMPGGEQPQEQQEPM
jgi:hypothetical protein